MVQNLFGSILEILMVSGSVILRDQFLGCSGGRNHNRCCTTRSLRFISEYWWGQNVLESVHSYRCLPKIASFSEISHEFLAISQNFTFRVKFCYHLLICSNLKRSSTQSFTVERIALQDAKLLRVVSSQKLRLASSPRENAWEPFRKLGKRNTLDYFWNSR